LCNGVTALTWTPAWLNPLCKRLRIIISRLFTLCRGSLPEPFVSPRGPTPHSLSARSAAGKPSEASREGELPRKEDVRAALDAAAAEVARAARDRVVTAAASLDGGDDARHNNEVKGED